MRRLLSNFVPIFGLNLVLWPVGVLVAYLVYAYFPADGYSAQPILITVIALALIVLTAWALWPPTYRLQHVIGGMVAGAGAVLALIYGFIGSGWQAMLAAIGLVLLAIVFLVTVSLFNYRIAREEWPWE